MSSLIGNGLSAENETGDQRWKEAQGQDYLQQQAREASGSSEICTSKNNRHITLENCSNVTAAFIIEDVATVPELVQKIFERFPNANSDAVGLRVSDTRTGSLNRQVFTEDLPADAVFLYVTLFLKKHPSVSTR
jgi:hypothetical protein